MVAVVYGGRSQEYDVSLMSATSIIDSLDTTRFDVLPLGITQEGMWVVGAHPSEPENGRMVAQLPQEVIDSVDLFLPIMHGTNGEDGAIQGYFEIINKPYVGAGVVGSAVGMDKAIFKNVMEAHEIPILPWALVLRSQWQLNQDTIVDELDEFLTYPMFTKPANLGSSVGISKCTDRDELIAGLNDAAAHDRRIVVEQGIPVRELEVSVMGNDTPIASIVGEIRPLRDFYDYEAKYVTDDSELIIPAELPEEMAEYVRELAVKAYQAIDCAGLGRVDFLLDTESNNIYINEINTLPGFTSISMYPKLWDASGISYPDLLTQLIDYALERSA